MRPRASSSGVRHSAVFLGRLSLSMRACVERRPGCGRQRRHSAVFFGCPSLSPLRAGSAINGGPACDSHASHRRLCHVMGRKDAARGGGRAPGGNASQPRPCRGLCPLTGPNKCLPN
jgi:hypothetical protein